MPRSEKFLKENFVANLPGGSISEINYVIAVAPAAVVLWSALQTRFSVFTPYTPDAFVLDFLLNCGAVLLATTLYSSAPVLLSALLLGPAALIYALPNRSRRTKTGVKGPRTRPATNSNGGSPTTSGSPLPRRPFVSIYRGCMLIMTCVAILAVDFKIFPRRFGKTETWGQSLMDLGVGSFVFSAGLVGVRASLKEDSQGRQSIQRIGKQLLGSTIHALPIFLLGIIRLLSVKKLDYQEHVTEYGVHWNFFFTLALLPPFAVIFRTLFAFVPSYAGLSLVVGATYTAFLELTNLKKYIIAAPRTDLLSMNREGVFSFVGYLAIYLAGQHAGTRIFARTTSGKTSAPGPNPSTESRFSLGGVKRMIKDITSREPLLVSLTFSTLWWTTLFWWTTKPSSFFPSWSPSRRLANISYILWIAAVNNGQLLICYLIQRIFFPSSSGKTDGEENMSISPIVEGFNKNGLVVFVVANLMTGGVNLMVDTLAASAPTSIAILMLYMGVLSGVALYGPRLPGSPHRRKVDEGGGRSSS
ncbi:MAG: 1-phosphatidylinositol-3-phosphate 5-kinase [Watsoniomyces obsoletus]|nr:MAG: 1-phosphatidylinositol-3-phosphate 5-kinase [Watsoniomyces obsoletus]